MAEGGPGYEDHVNQKGLMMQVIYKWSWGTDVVLAIATAASAKVLHFGLDPAGVPSIWTLNNPESQSLSARQFVLRMTGEHFEGGTYIGTCIRGALVLHCFELV
jgi:hypothetical protein